MARKTLVPSCVKNRTIEVNQKAIDTGVPNEPRRCMVAQAIRMQVPDLSPNPDPEVSDRQVRFNVVDPKEGKEYRLYYDLPPDAVAACLVAQFDEVGGKEAVKPFTLKLARKNCALKPVRRLGTRESRGLPPKPKHGEGKRAKAKAEKKTPCKRRYRGLATKGLVEALGIQVQNQKEA